jgi:predicted phosphoribosyltransferase
MAELSAKKTVIVVDDGLATGSSMQAAVLALRRLRSARSVVAAPAASPKSVTARVSTMVNVIPF